MSMQLASSEAPAPAAAAGEFNDPAFVNSMLAQNDALLTAALTALGAPVLDLRAIDMGVNECDAREDDEAVNKCRCKGYLDRTGLHPGPQLAGRQTHLEQLVGLQGKELQPVHAARLARLGKVGQLPAPHLLQHLGPNPPLTSVSSEQL